MTDITVPQLGESVTEATVGQWLKSAGDTVAKDEVLVELETDKVSIEVSAPEDGTLSEISAAEGDTVEIGALLGRVNSGGAAATPAPAAAPAEPAPATAPAPKPNGALIDVAVPVMGESVAEGTIGTLLKGVGDAVTKDETIAEIETDKVALEIPATSDGVIAELLVGEGDTVTPGCQSLPASPAMVSVELLLRLRLQLPAAAAPSAAPAATGERPVCAICPPQSLRRQV